MVYTAVGEWSDLHIVLESVYPKCHLVFLINWKRKFKILYLDFVFTSITKTWRNSNNWLPFSCLIDIFFEFLIPSFVFRFHKKWKTKYSSFFVFHFSWRNWKTNYLNRSRLVLWSLSQVWSTRYSKASSCQVPWGFPKCSVHADTKNSLFRKQVMDFNVYIAGCYFHIWFVFIVNCDIKHTSRSSHREVFC